MGNTKRGLPHSKTLRDGPAPIWEVRDSGFGFFIARLRSVGDGAVVPTFPAGLSTPRSPLRAPGF